MDCLPMAKTCAWRMGSKSTPLKLHRGRSEKISTNARLLPCARTSASIPPNSFALARSVECFKIPRDVLTICVGKSNGIVLPKLEGVEREIGSNQPVEENVEGLAIAIRFEPSRYHD